MRRQARLPLVRLGAVVVALFALTGVVLAAVPVAAQSSQSVTVQLKEENNSGVSGTAVLTAEGNQTKVEIQITNADGGRPAGIHQGTCANLNPEATYPLETVQSNGKSVTTISATLASLESGQFVVNLRQSSTELGVYVACGAITTTSAAIPSPPVTAAPTTTAAAVTAPVTAAVTATPQPVAAGGLLAVNTPPATGAGVTALHSVSIALLIAAGLLAALCVAAGLVLRRRATLA